MFKYKVQSLHKIVVNLTNLINLNSVYKKIDWQSQNNFVLQLNGDSEGGKDPNQSDQPNKPNDDVVDPKDGNGADYSQPSYEHNTGDSDNNFPFPNDPDDGFGIFSIIMIIISIILIFNKRIRSWYTIYAFWKMIYILKVYLNKGKTFVIDESKSCEPSTNNEEAFNKLLKNWSPKEKNWNDGTQVRAFKFMTLYVISKNDSDFEQLTSLTYILIDEASPYLFEGYSYFNVLKFRGLWFFIFEWYDFFAARITKLLNYIKSKFFGVLNTSYPVAGVDSKYTKWSEKLALIATIVAAIIFYIFW